MKILTLHCDYIKFKPLKKAIKNPEEIKEKGQIEVREPLVVLTAVEKGDNDKTVAQLIDAVKKTSSEVKTKTIVLYPYAHLSSNLADPDTALEYMVEAEHTLKKEGYNVTRAPFGYYKEFELKVKGHPLSELSKEFRPESLALSPKEVVIRHDEEKKFAESERLNFLKSMTKQKMSFEKGKNNMKGNAELGKELELFVGSEIVGSGLPLLTPKGATIKRELERFVVDEELKRGYLHTDTPVMAKADLYKISGHYAHYKDSMFILKIGEEEFALRPMTCPFQFIIYKSKQRSYKELPIKYAEISDLFRNEQSGELMGLTRLRQFTLSDAHIICAPEQLEEQFAEVLDFVKFMMKSLGITGIWYRFSKWDPKNKEKYIDNPKAWEESQKMMKKILDKLKVKYVEAENEAAFYGPKLDLQYENVYGKEDTLITIQIDFALPEKFDMTYIDKDGKEKRPMVIHRSSIGCFERTMAYILEKTQGNLPLWLSPIQVRVIDFTDRNTKACEKLIKQLKEELPMLRIDSDFRSTTVSDKVRDAEIQRIPYVIVLGDKEEESKTIAVRERGNAKPKFKVKLDSFIKEIKEKIEKRT
jgi:threonyl-tRNA synthetase